MQRRLAAVLVLALLVVLAAVLWLNRSAEPQRVERGSGEDAAAVATDAELASVATEASGRSEAQPTEVASEASAGAAIAQGSDALAVLLVRVTHVESGPVVGARVRALRRGQGDWVEAQTDAEGAARFETAGALEIAQVNVPATHLTTPAMTQSVPRVPPGEVRELSLAVDSGVSVSGRVVDTSGAPVGGAIVEGWCSSGRHGAPVRSTITDATGAFVVPHMGPESWIEARHEARGLVSRRGLFGLPPPGTSAEGLEIELVEATSFVVRVTDERQRPLSGVFMHAYRDHVQTPIAPGMKAVPTGEFRGTTALDGTLRIANVAPAAYDISIQFESYVPFREHVRANGEEQIIVLREGSVVTGRVFDADGAPAVGARVASDSWYSMRGPKGGTTCGADGSFRLIGLEEDTALQQFGHFLVVTHEGHAVEVVENVPHSVDGSAPPVEVRLVRGASIRGHVVDSTGAPLARAEVVAAGSRSTERTPFRGVNSVEAVARVGMLRTEADGSFALEHLLPETYTLTVRPADGREREFTFEVAAGTDDARLVVDLAELRGAVVHGRVFDFATRQPVMRFEVWPPGRGSSDGANGAFEIDGLAPGRHVFAFEAPGHAQQRSPEIELVAGEQTVEFLLVGSAPLVLRVVDSDGQPWGVAASVRLNAGEAATAALGREFEHSTQHRGGSDTIDCGLAPTLPLELEILVPGGAHRQEIVPGATDGPIEIVVPGRKQVDVEFIVVKASRSLDLDELVRRLRSNADEDRAWIDAQRAAGLVRDAGEDITFTLNESIGDGRVAPNESLAVGRLVHFVANWRESEFFDAWGNSHGISFDGARMKMRLVESTWKVNAIRMNAPNGELPRAVHVAFGPDIGPEPELGVVVLLE
jgi:protocatechuate 3,4-dioxygenase beta subunit